MSDYEVPRGAVESERVVIGTILVRPTALIDTIAAGVKPDSFTLEGHRRLYARILELLASGQPVDLVTVADCLARHNELSAVGGAAYISSLTHGLPLNLDVRHHAGRITEQAALQRMALRLEAMLRQSGEAGARLKDFEGVLSEVLKDVQGHTGKNSIQRFCDVPDVLNLCSTPVEYLVDGLIPLGAVVLIAGEAGKGKSLLALNLAVGCCITGTFITHKCRQAPVLILDAENPLVLIQQRLKKLVSGPVLNLRIWGGWLNEGPPKIGDARLLDIAKETKPLLIIDTLVRLHSADENSASEMRTVMAELRKLADAGATVVLLHHKPKSESTKYRGSSDILAAVDLAWSLSADVDANLRFDLFKNRFGPEKRLVLKPQLQDGIFHLLADASLTRAQNNDTELVLDLLEHAPGISQNAIVSRLRQEHDIGRTRALTILKRHEGQRWKAEKGPMNSLLYYPIAGGKGQSCHAVTPLVGV